MLCPEGSQPENDTLSKSNDICQKKPNKVPAEGTDSLELTSYKNPKTWKRSISNFFRNQLRSTKSNEGDRPSGSKDNFEEKEITPDQKWQSLGKVFRRQSFAETWNKSPKSPGENSSHSKRLAVKKVISSYFGKSQKVTSADGEK
ncbi:uncharacterized protein LOC114239682 [Bombyx mandarina]|uniref:Uncharacterized protein LOC114239682 n=1 Tax=Bombyx mandarina TaxID=7092 RepID=A0A6J2J8P6_BOMMA|nr:uncharacterized protein LOC114239682 [Bombyx mandarina]